MKAAVSLPVAEKRVAKRATLLVVVVIDVPAAPVGKVEEVARTARTVPGEVSVVGEMIEGLATANVSLPVLGVPKAAEVARGRVRRTHENVAR